MLPVKSLLCLTATVAASSMEQVIQSVSNINSNVEKLTEKVNAWDGGLISAAPQLLTLGLISKALDSGVYHTGHLHTLLTSKESTTLLDHVNATLYVSNPIAVDAVLKKMDKYEKIGTTGTIAASLKKLLDGHGKFSANIVIRLPEEFLQRGVELSEHITLALRKGILAFGG
ncbi:hypothetical protein K4F52_006493 [Lecanicillium sp. MT-2017a]|nr:hypothetical protein K4F52_006493 [Lecanicillium sp. MT-2017a]